jgi:hypothetical protein
MTSAAFVISVLIVNAATALFVVALDRFLAPLAPLIRFAVQAPLLTCALDYFRAEVRRQAHTYGLTANTVESAFYLTGGIAVVFSPHLIRDMQSLCKFG